VCANLSQSAAQATATNLRLTCASGGDPITSHTITNQPDHGLLDATSLNSGLLGYTSTAGYSGPDFLEYRATSTCGAASCQSESATFDLQMLDPSREPRDQRARRDPPAPGATGATGPAGQDGAAGAPGAPGSVVTQDRLFIASYLDGLTARRGRAVTLRYVSTTSARVVLEVLKGTRRVAALPGTARPGKNAIRWNGKVDGSNAPAGIYRLKLTATSGEQVARDRVTVRLR
jgi:hypothetical protein